MKNKRILLAFDGSTQSLNAAELCWELAAKHPIQLTAQHVVNTVGLWQLLNFELPGLTGSGPYIAAHEAMSKELRSIGETLVAIYDTKAKSSGQADQCVLDEGDAISEVARRARTHDLVVIGHRPTKAQEAWSTSKDKHDPLPRYLTHFSMAETLTRVLDKPLLVVQSLTQPWKAINLILHGNAKLNESFQAAVELATFFNLPLEVNSYFIGDASDAEIPDLKDLVAETEKLHPQLVVKTRQARLWPNAEDAHLASISCDADSLVVIPTFLCGAERQSAFGTDINLFVRYAGVNSLLFYPVDVQEKPASAITGSAAAVR